MAGEAFERELLVPSVPRVVWATVTDVHTLVGWVSILEDAEVLEELSRYRAVLMDRLGMFSLRADLDIRVTGHEEPTWLHAVAEGEDRQMASRISVELDLRLAERDDGTALSARGAYEVTGRVATLGGATIRRKADRILEEFFGHLSEALA